MKRALTPPAGAMDAKVKLRIPSAKIVDYLLNVDHPEGGSKARYFLSFGFSADEPGDFVRALFTHWLPANHKSSQDGLWGRKLVFEGPLSTPDGRKPRIRTIWLISPRDPAYADLISAYPTG